MAYKQNEIIIKKQYAIIKIKNNLYGDFDCLINKEDVGKIKDLFWNIRYDKRHPKCLPYVESHSLGKRIHLHRYIINCPKEKVVDHINGNTLDNRKANLRICTQAENCKNQNSAKNIYYNKRDNLYTVQFSINRKTKYLCYTRDYEEAEKYAKWGRQLLSENRVDELLETPCKCIMHSYHRQSNV